VSTMQKAMIAGFTTAERDYIRRELDQFFACLLLFTRCESAPDEVGNDPRPGETVEVPTYKPFWDGHRWGWYR
jgi:hypothetical protein